MSFLQNESNVSDLMDPQNCVQIPSLEDEKDFDSPNDAYLYYCSEYARPSKGNFFKHKLNIPEFKVTENDYLEDLSDDEDTQI